MPSRLELTLCVRGRSIVDVPFQDQQGYVNPNAFSGSEAERSFAFGQHFSNLPYPLACCEEFIAYMENFQRLSCSRRSPNQPSEYRYMQATIQASSFANGTPLHRLLSKPSEERAGFKVSTSLQDLCHFAALLYLHLTLWEFRNDLHATQQYLKRIRLHIIENGLLWAGSIEGLLWILLVGGDSQHLDTPLRARQVVRMMQVARKLSEDSWKTTQRILAEGLLGEEWTGCELDPGWDADRIRYDILSGSNALPVDEVDLVSLGDNDYEQ